MFASNGDRRDWRNGLPNNATSSPAAQIVRTWDGGPLREFSTERIRGWIRHCRYPFAGRYVCECCLRPAAGVYRLKGTKAWVCARCRSRSFASNTRAREAHEFSDQYVRARGRAVSHFS